MGFTTYNSRPVPPTPTTQEMVAALSGGQKVAILDGFANKVISKTVFYKTGIKLSVINHLYKKLDEIEEASRHLMRGEVVITPEVVDPQTGEVTTPAVYNTPPTSAAELLLEVQDAFSEDFTSGQVTAILTKMVEYSHWDHSGDWAFYSSEVIK